MRKEFNIREINLLEIELLQIMLKREEIVEIKVKIKELKKEIKNSNSILFDKKKSITRLDSLQRNCDRKLQHFVSKSINVSLDLMYSLQYQSLIKNKQLSIHFPNPMIIIENSSININDLSKKVWNPHLNSLGSSFIHDVIGGLIGLLKEEKMYTNTDVCITDEGHNYRIEITLKKFYTLGKINSPFRNEIKKIFIENSLSTICYIKRVSPVTENESENYFFVKENYINVSKIAIYLGSSLKNFDIKNVELIANSSRNLFLIIDVNKYAFSQKINKEIVLPSLFPHRLVHKNNVNFLYRLMNETNRNLPPWSYIYSEKDIYLTPSKLSNIKNIMIYVAYKISTMLLGTNVYMHIDVNELCSAGFLKYNRSSEKYLFNSYLYLKLFLELYGWPDTSLEILYTHNCKYKTPHIIIKKMNINS